MNVIVLSTCTQTNGLTERFNQTLLWNLCKLIAEDKSKSNWDLKIETVLMGFRSSRQETTKQSPYYMLFQKQMRLPIDSEMIPPQNLCSSSSENELQSDIIQALLESRETCL